MDYQSTSMNIELNKEYRNRKEATAANIRQARNAQQENKSRKPVSILRVISQIIVNIK